jgi:sulfatase maturation enzyme AslB (radical SAM superfamily)
MTWFPILDHRLRYKLRSMKRGRDWSTPISHDCEVIERTIAIDSESDIFLCKCEGWLPVPVGKVGDFNSLQDVWQSPVAQNLIQDVKDHKFTWCAVETCGVYQGPQRQSMVNLWINIDDSCNLACPSCRRHPIMYDSGDIFDRKTKDIFRIMGWLESFHDDIMVTLSGSGDALASHITRPLLTTYRARDNVFFQIKTNGLLLEKVMTKSTVRDRVKLYSVSVDAASRSVYEDVRRPGRWDALMRNLSWLAANRGDSDVVLNFTVQNKNFRDMPDFQVLCRDFDFHCNFTPLDDWATWPSATTEPDSWAQVNGFYSDHDVCRSAHPAHREFLSVLGSLDHDTTHTTIAPRLTSLL